MRLKHLNPRLCKSIHYALIARNIWKMFNSMTMNLIFKQTDYPSIKCNEGYALRHVHVTIVT